MLVYTQYVLFSSTECAATAGAQWYLLLSNVVVAYVVFLGGLVFTALSTIAYSALKEAQDAAGKLL